MKPLSKIIGNVNLSFSCPSCNSKVQYSRPKDLLPKPKYGVSVNESRRKDTYTIHCAHCHTMYHMDVYVSQEKRLIEIHQKMTKLRIADGKIHISEND